MTTNKEVLEEKRKERVGEIGYNKYNSKMKIVEYYDKDNIIVEFQDEYRCKKKTNYNNFQKRSVKNPYDKIVYNIGYLGEGKYRSKENGERTKCYITWINMLKRCYDPYSLNKNLSYIDCFVCEEWHNFQNFAKWYEENYYECNSEKIDIDKDILYKNNKIYSPNTCILVPQRINQLFIKQCKKDKKYPIGVCYYKNDKLNARCSIIVNGKNKLKHLGYFPLNRPFQAFTVYKNFKENYIKQVADEYKDLIPKKLYDALYKYEVEIND